MKIKVEVYESKDGWRVRLRARNGKILLDSEAYSSASKCLKTAKGVAKALGVEVKTRK